MARGFCGCGRKVRFSMRPLNTRGKQVRARMRDVETVLGGGLRSPKGEHFVADGQTICELLAASVHANVDPGDDVERTIRGWQKIGRDYFSAAALGQSLKNAGLSPEEGVAAMRRREFAPYAEAPMMSE
jgi:hypothetical protein